MYYSFIKRAYSNLIDPVQNFFKEREIKNDLSAFKNTSYLKDKLNELGIDENLYAKYRSLDIHPYTFWSSKCNKFVADYLSASGYDLPKVNENNINLSRKLQNAIGRNTVPNNREYTVSEFRDTFSDNEGPNQYFKEIPITDKTDLLDMHPFYSQNNRLNGLKENDIYTNPKHMGIIVKNPEYGKYIFNRPNDKWLLRSANPYYGTRDMYLKDEVDRDKNIKIYRPIKKSNNIKK